MKKLQKCALVLVTVVAIVYILRWVLGCGGLSSKEYLEIDSTELRTGDLLLRMGLGGESYTVEMMSGGDYSHVGLALQTDSGWMVVHAVPGEAAEGEEEWLKCERITAYYDRDHAQDGCIARVMCSDSVAKRATAYALAKQQARVLFDNDYEADDSTLLYCTELVWRAYKSVGIDLIENRRHDLLVGPAKDPVMYPEDVLRSKHVKMIKRLRINHIMNH